MKLESRKVLTAKKIGFAVFMILVMFVATLSFPYEISTGSYILLNQIQGHTSNNTSKLLKLFNVTMSFKTTAFVKRKTTLTTKVNHQKDVATTKATKAETKIPTTTTPKNRKTTTNIPAITTKTPKTTRMKISTIITETPKRTTMKIPTIRTSSVGHRIQKTSTVHPKTTVPPKHFVCLRLMGRLGNLMFEYASSYGMARSKGMEVVISKNERLSKIFQLDRGGKVLADTSMCKGVKTKYEVRASAFDKKTMDFSNDKNIAIVGYLQSYKYFEKVSDELRRQFVFRDSIKTKADNIVRGFLQKYLVKHGNESQKPTFVGVHVRRGDMVNHPHGYAVAPKEYFQRSQNMFRALYKNVIFLVCSDDIGWSKSNMKSEDTYFVEGNSPEVDMATLSSCNHTISSVGSFSWWSAWLANGLVTYYCPPARPGSDLRKEYSKDFSDYFPSKWIRIKL